MEAVSAATYHARVIEASHRQPVLVDVWGPRCGPCIKMMPFVERLSHEHVTTLSIVKLDSSQNRRFCLELGLMGLPAFLLYRDGEVVQRLSGDACTPAAVERLVMAADQAQRT